MAEKIKLKSDEQTHLESVITSTLSHYIDYIFPGIYDIIKMKTGYTSDIEAQLKKLNPDGDNSYYVYSVIEPNVDAFYANSFDIDTMWRPMPIKTDTESKKAVKDASDYLSWVEAISNWKDVEDMMRGEATLIGTSYCKAGYVKKLKNKLPYAEHVSFFELFTTPGAKDFYKSRFKIYRKIMSDREIQGLYGSLLTEKQIKELDDIRGECFIDWDFNKIWDLKYYEKAISDEVALITDDLTPVQIFTRALSRQFMVIDGENGNNEVIEVWDGGKCHIYINKKYFASYEEYIDAPFACMVFEKQSGTYLGRGLGHKLMPAQLEANFIYNSLRKGIRQDVFPDTLTIPGAIVDPVTGQTPVVLSYQGGKNYSLNPSASFGGEAFKKISYTGYDTISLLKQRLVEVVQEAQVIAGTSSYTLGGQGKVERVAGGVAQRNEVFLARQKPMVASIKSMKAYMFYVWLEIAKKIDKDLLVKISESGEETTIKDINIDSIINKTHVWIDSETNKSIRRYENVNLGTQILGTLGSLSNLPEAQKYIVSVLKKVANDYAYDGIEDEQEEVQQSGVDEGLIQQLSQQEANLKGNDDIQRNQMLSRLTSSIPMDSGDDTEIPDVEF